MSQTDDSSKQAIHTIQLLGQTVESPVLHWSASSFPFSATVYVGEDGRAHGFLTLVGATGQFLGATDADTADKVATALTNRARAFLAEMDALRAPQPAAPQTPGAAEVEGLQRMVAELMQQLDQAKQQLGDALQARATRDQWVTQAAILLVKLAREGLTEENETQLQAFVPANIVVAPPPETPAASPAEPSRVA